MSGLNLEHLFAVMFPISVYASMWLFGERDHRRIMAVVYTSIFVAITLGLLR